MRPQREVRSMHKVNMPIQLEAVLIAEYLLESEMMGEHR